MKRIIFFTIIGSLLLVSISFAELLKVELTIFGMDWALCAHAVRTGFKKLEATEKVEVSLKKGLATLEFKKDNKITFSEMENIVKRNGFSPKSARVTFRGKIAQNPPQVTVTGSNESIPADFHVDLPSDKQQSYLMQGNVKIGDKGTESITISAIKN